MLTLDQAIEELSLHHINLQLEFSTDKDGYLLYQLRVLPWRNNPRQGYMILVADHTLTSCLIMAAEEIEGNRWAVLNWKVSMQEPGRFFGYGGIGLIKSTSTPSDGHPVQMQRPIRTVHSQDGDNAS